MINFMTPGARFNLLKWDHIKYIVKVHYFFKNLLFFSQIKYNVMMTK